MTLSASFGPYVEGSRACHTMSTGDPEGQVQDAQETAAASSRVNSLSTYYHVAG